MRTFIALELPAPSQQQVAAVQQRAEQHLRQARLASPFTWTPAEKTHITLRFLGETTDEQRSSILNGLTTIATQADSFQLAFHGLGCFPNFRRPRVLWIGLQGDLDALRQLQAPVEQLAQQAGFPAEERPFSPHLTIARTRRDADPAGLSKAGQAVREFAQALTADPQLLPATTFTIHEVVLMRSELLPGGARYTPLATFGLG
jgi:RNA 2',3'-cyclic 3'-phosphodiesterase